MPSLVEPAAQLKESYVALVDEFVAAGEDLVPFCLGFPHDDFEALIARLSDHSRGLGVPEGFVANSTFWLVDDHLGVVGVSNVRHRLTAALAREGGHIGFGVRPSCRRRGFGSLILKLSLARARDLGISRALLTCDRDNTGSVRVIIGNGGVLDSEEFLTERHACVQRYWIETDAQSA